jgi:molecular chaperone DnaJ
MQDFYELLGVSRAATDEEIKRAYRKLARELHPDVSGGDPEAEERFKEVTVAYETLRDPERRRRYDMFGPEGARAGTGPDFGFGGFGDIFDAFFGGGFARERQGGGRTSRGADLEIAVELGFEEAVFGTEHEVRLETPAPCSTCGASGAQAGTYPTRCSACNGSGELRRVRHSILGQVMTASPCTRCGGRGEEITKPCPDCRGEGRRMEERAYTVDIPPGIDTGQTLRLTGRGAAGMRGAPPGDLYVHVRVQPHDRFQRQGYDLIHVLQLPMTQAALGAHLAYETLDGVEDLVIPAGTQAGRVFRLRGRGIPHLEGRGRGDLLVQVAVETPTGLTAEQEDMLRQLADDRGESVAPPEKGFLGRIRSAFK